MVEKFYGVGIGVAIKPKETTWIAKIRYHKVLLVRISVRRLDPEITDLQWTSLAETGQEIVEILIEQMKNSEDGFSVTGLRKIEKWCIENGAEETTSREIKWNGLRVYFAFLYSNPNKKNGEYSRSRGYNGKNKDHV